MRYKLLILASILVVMPLVLMLGFPSSPRYRVIEVIDGDTLILENGARLRLLGIDAPERGQEFYLESKQYLQELVLGKSLILERDLKKRDRHGRWLGYLILNGTLVNQLMLERGLARLFLWRGLRYQHQLEQAQLRAILAGEGVWNHSRWYHCIWIKHFHPHPDPQLEFGILHNNCSKLDLGGWYFLNELGDRYALPRAELDQGMEVIFRTGSAYAGELGLGSSRSLGWNSGWIALMDSRGRLVSYLRY